MGIGKMQSFVKNNISAASLHISKGFCTFARILYISITLALPEGKRVMT
jgi:hypothetical protein